MSLGRARQVLTESTCACCCYSDHPLFNVHGRRSVGLDWHICGVSDRSQVSTIQHCRGSKEGTLLDFSRVHPHCKIGLYMYMVRQELNSGFPDLFE